MKLLLAIPALNEERSIEGIIERSLRARRSIISQSPVDEVEITVVSDGSTDRTVEIAARHEGLIKLIVFPENRGYGAAIKEAWRQSDADLLGFLDADGTCDPLFFARLCNAICRDGADIAIGSRLNRASRMPVVRKVGNLAFASMLRVLSSKSVNDTASGMRVVRQSSLPRIYPLPDGLHFTPAMSARALLDSTLTVVELDMPYHEREGQSKLKIGKDGLRFLHVILNTSLLYRPSRPLAILGCASLAVSLGLMLMPALYYLRHGSVSEWMIYRFVVSELIGTGAALFFSTAYLTTKILRLRSDTKVSRWWERVERSLTRPWFWSLPASCVFSGCALVIPSFLQLVRTGATYEHWSRFIAMSFLLAISQILVITWIIDHVLNLIRERLAYIEEMDSAGVPEPAGVVGR